MAAYPGAKVILSVRYPAKWCAHPGRVAAAGGLPWGGLAE